MTLGSIQCRIRNQGPKSPSGKVLKDNTNEFKRPMAERPCEQQGSDSWQAKHRRTKADLGSAWNHPR